MVGVEVTNNKESVPEFITKVVDGRGVSLRAASCWRDVYISNQEGYSVLVYIDDENLKVPVFDLDFRGCFVLEGDRSMY